MTTNEQNEDLTFIATIGRVSCRVVARGSIVGEWRMSPHHPAVPPRRERVIHDVTIYSADFYGTGEREYAKGDYRIESDGEAVGPRYGFWDDGNSQAVATWKALVLRRSL